MSTLHVTRRGAGVLLALSVGFLLTCGMTGIGTLDQFVWMP